MLASRVLYVTLYVCEFYLLAYPLYVQYLIMESRPFILLYCSSFASPARYIERWADNKRHFIL